MRYISSKVNVCHYTFCYILHNTAVIVTLLHFFDKVIVSVSKANIHSYADTTSDNLFYSRTKVVVGHTIENEFQALNIKLGKGAEDNLDPDVVRDIQLHYKVWHHDPDFKAHYRLPELEQEKDRYGLKILAYMASPWRRGAGGWHQHPQ